MTALDDIIVLDLSHALAGPFASTMLADFGARVIKIEPPDRGDMSRAWGPPFHGADSTYFIHLNRNKESVAIDLKRPEGRSLLLRLADRADVLLENLRVGALDALGLGPGPLRARRPSLVYCSISGFGQDGPYRDRAALDLIVQAESGMISITGEPGGRGVRCGVSIADITAGMYAAFAIVTALHARQKTGRGQFIDVSMLEAQLDILQGAIGAYLADGIVPQPMGTAYGPLLPYQTFRTRTRDIAIGIGSDRLWLKFCEVVMRPDLGEDPRYRTNADRRAHRAPLIGTLQEIFLTRSYEEWESMLVPAGIPAGAINTIDKVVDHPQVAARGALATCAHPEGTLRTVSPPVRMDGTPASIRSAAPRLGEHTGRVLREILDMRDEEIDALHRSGAIGMAGRRHAEAPTVDTPGGGRYKPDSGR